jgi:hypothetical protein
MASPLFPRGISTRPRCAHPTAPSPNEPPIAAVKPPQSDGTRCPHLPVDNPAPLRGPRVRQSVAELPQPRTCGRLGGGPPGFADCSFGTLDDQSSSGRLVAGSATKT